MSVLVARLCDVYMHLQDGRQLWNALDTKFDAMDVSNEQYIMKRFHDYEMQNNHL